LDSAPDVSTLPDIQKFSFLAEEKVHPGAFRNRVKNILRKIRGGAASDHGSDCFRETLLALGLLDVQKKPPQRACVIERPVTMTAFEVIPDDEAAQIMVKKVGEEAF
jgi:hypothetical protein